MQLTLGTVILVAYLGLWEVSILLCGDLMQWDHPVLLTYLQISACSLFIPFMWLREKHFTLTDMKHASITGILYFTASITYVWSLKDMLGSINSCLYQLSIVVTYLLAICVLGEKATLLNFMSISLTITGAIIIAVLGDTREDGKETKVFAILLLLLSCALFPTYYVFATKWIPSENKLIETLAYSGLQGACTMLLFWPIILILHFTTPTERVESPPSDLILPFILLVILKPVLCAGSLFPTILVSPVFSSVGFVLILPLSMVGDMIWRKAYPPVWFYIGMVTIVIGCFFNIASQSSQKHEKETGEKHINSL